jgi:hypothetical protein
LVPGEVCPVKGENTAQRKEAARRYFEWKEFVIDEWQPAIDPHRRIKRSTAKLVALAKATRTDYGRAIFRSDQYVAEATGLDRMTVQRHTRYLEEAGLFRPTGRRHGRAREMVIATPAMLPQAATDTDTANDRMMPQAALNDASGIVDSDASGSTNLPMNLPNESLTGDEFFEDMQERSRKREAEGVATGPKYPRRNWDDYED